MPNKSNPPRVLLIVGTLYLIFYSIFSLVNLFLIKNTGVLNLIFYGTLLITLVGSWGLWNQKKIFSRPFWKYFLIFQLVFSPCYFYFLYNISPVFVGKIALFLPLCFIIYFYAFKKDLIWKIAEEVQTTQNNTIDFKSHAIFFIGLILITLLYNPFPKDNLSPSDYNSLGVRAAYRGDVAGEKRFYFKGLKAAKKLHQEDTAAVAKIYHNLSICYDEGLNEKASVFYDLKAIAIYEKLLKENKIKKGSQEYHMLGEAYYVAGASDITGDIKKKIQYLNKAMKIFIELKDNRGIATCNEGFGTVYNNAKDYKRSKIYYEKAIRISDKNNIQDLLANNYKMYADSLFDQKKYAQAEKFALMAINTYKKDENQDPTIQRRLGNAYTVLGKIKSAQGNCEDATKYYSIGIPIMNQTVKKPELIIKLHLKMLKDECEASKVSQ